MNHFHCVKTVCIRSFSGPYFPAFGLNMERYYVSLRTQSECGKMRISKTPNTDTFHAAFVYMYVLFNMWQGNEYNLIGCVNIWKRSQGSKILYWQILLLELKFFQVSIIKHLYQYILRFLLAYLFLLCEYFLMVTFKEMSSFSEINIFSTFLVSLRHFLYLFLE